ncbi:MAG: hypothetical protein SGI74_01690 [Oligoflexia bacterium]|nr:hypothetical protein [Oligoflexia bacterium]
MAKPINAAQVPVPTPTQEKGGQGNGGKVSHQGPSKNNVISLPGMCLAESCKSKSEKANFCMEHFDWFKEGLITKEGRKPTDFNKKFYDYSRRLMKKSA